MCCTAMRSAPNRTTNAPPMPAAFAMVAARPKTLLLSEAAMREDAEAVRKLLVGAKDICAIVEVRRDIILG